MIRVNGIGTVHSKQFMPYLSWLPVPDKQPASKTLEHFIDAFQGGMDEAHPGIVRVKFVKQVAVKNKQALDLFSRPQGMIKPGIVVEAQVATKPEQGKGSFHT